MTYRPIVCEDCGRTVGWYWWYEHRMAVHRDAKLKPSTITPRSGRRE